MPTSPTRTGARHASWRVVLVLVLLLVLVAAVVLVSVNPFKSADPPRTDCTQYGLRADDSRAFPHTVTLATQPTAQDQTQAGALGHLEQTYTYRGTTSSYHVIDGGVDVSKPVGLVIDLHGDGGAEYFEPGGRTTCLSAIAASHNDLLAVPLTPDCQGECTWWQGMGANMRWLRALTENRLLADLPVQRDRVSWFGYSGGAEMLSYGVLSGARDLVTGGAAMVGGGGAPDGLSKVPTRQEKAEVRMWWFTGLLDDGSDPASDFDAVTAATEGQRFYEKRGFTRTRLELMPHRDHFNMPDAEILDELLAADETTPST
ncbi:hypothetical protein [Kocuria marina]|uniref:hypothetical protein n=1 Tax=Kocuria marina TaxID=223184 RepID=UPI0034610628